MKQIGNYKLLGLRGTVLPPRLAVSVTVVLLLLANLGIALITPLLRREVSDFVIVGAAVLVHLCVLVFELLVSFSDPGIIPNEQLAKEVGGDTVKRPSTPSESLCEVVVKTDVYPLKFCVTCGSHRPLRAVHSRMGDCCIMRYDHFCKWLGTDIGMCNHWWFLCFLHSLCVETVFFATLAIVQIVMACIYRPPLVSFIAQLTVCGVSVLINVIVVEFVAKLIVYYVRLARFGMLTKEHAVGCDAEATAPFSTFNTLQNYCLPFKFRKEGLLRRYLARPHVFSGNCKDSFEFDRTDVKLWFEQAVVLSKRFVFNESAVIERRRQECPDKFDMRALNQEISSVHKEPSFVISIEDPWKK